MSDFSRYKCLILESKRERDKIKFCKIIKINPDFISEIVEIGHSYFRCPEKLYDELITFLSGRKIALIEKVNYHQSRKYQRFEIIMDEEILTSFHVDIKIKLNKLIMSNGNEYYVLAE